VEPGSASPASALASLVFGLVDDSLLCQATKAIIALNKKSTVYFNQTRKPSQSSLYSRNKTNSLVIRGPGKFEPV